MQENSEIMTINEVADFLKLSKITIYKLVQKGDIPAFRVGNSWRFQRDKIELMVTNPLPLENK
ncbi:MAG: helix-turn-helix domain-containing protein [Proteobacteria bacterium]|nr:helix-turn-helix domain-containing protein [Pseudomonadota bacterium]